MPFSNSVGCFLAFLVFFFKPQIFNFDEIQLMYWVFSLLCAFENKEGVLSATGLVWEILCGEARLAYES